MLNRKTIVRVMSVIVTLGLMVYLFSIIEWDDFGQMLARMSIWSIIIAFAAYLNLNVFRALRFRSLLDRAGTPLRLMVPITLYHNFLVRVLPFKLGELSYIMLLRSRLGYSVEEGVSSLFGARMLELIIIVIVCASALVTSGSVFSGQQETLIILMVVTFLASVASVYFMGSLIRIGRWVLVQVMRMFLPGRVELAAKIGSKLALMAHDFDRIREPRLFFWALFYSIFTYASSFVANYVLMRAVGIDIGFSLMAAIISLGMFASAFPFTVSGFGVVEFSWTVGLTMLAGMGHSQAASVGVMLHGFQVIASALYGGLGYLAVRLQDEDEKADMAVAEEMS